jgi:hypothetical protein
MMQRLLIALLLLLLMPSWSNAAKLFDLEITNIKPAGTGSPAIPSTNRIFRAYPGIEYNIRAAVIGGVYPYTYSLSNAPSGMTINSATGEIVWPNPQSNSGTITLSVTDSANDTVTAQWAITVGTSGFHFVDINASTNGTGTAASPFKTLANFLTATFNNGHNDDIVYFKSGTYQLVHHNAGYATALNVQANPRNWIAYPGHSVTLQGGSGVGQADRIVVWGGDFYFDGLTIKDMVGYGIYTDSGQTYKTIRRCIFTGLVPPDNVNNNYGFIHITSGNKGYGSVIQDNEFTDWVGASAIGSIYKDDKLLIENNRIHSPRATSTYSGISTTIGIAPKVDNDYLTIRGNSVIMNKGYLIGGLNASYYQSDYSEISFNLFVNNGPNIVGSLFDWETIAQGITKFWRNTNISHLGLRGPTGPYIITNNVVVNNGQPIEGGKTVTNYLSYPSSSTLTNYATYTDNLTGSDASLLVDSANNYKLVSGQSAYIGSRGWQLADGSTPMDGTYTPPDPTCSDGIQNGDETGVDCGGSCPACEQPPTSNGTLLRAGTTPLRAGTTPITIPVQP